MKPIDAFRSAFKNYVNFSGRASRGDFWWYVLAYVIGAVVLSILDRLLFGGGSAEMSMDDGMMMYSADAGVLTSLWILANIIPSISIGARRLHDIGRSGWLQLVVLIPLLGALYLLYLYVSEGNSGENRFGPDPLGGVSGT